jgi:hypothetical protein
MAEPCDVTDSVANTTCRELLKTTDHLETVERFHSKKYRCPEGRAYNNSPETKLPHLTPPATIYIQLNACALKSQCYSVSWWHTPP